MNIKSITLATSALIISTSVNATVIYDENIDGDISLTNFGPLGVGSNTITGITSWVGSTFDFDGFLFTIPAGTQVSSFLVDFTTSGSLTSTNDFGVFSGGSFPTSLFNFTIGAGSGSQVDILALAGGNLVPGTYAIQQTLGGQGSINYTYSADVNAVSIPAAVWLFGSGLIGLVGFSRRKT